MLTNELIYNTMSLVIIMNNKQDLRVIKTKRNLYGSLLLNMKDKPFEEIKVRDICEKALVNRSTFYTHFEDKYDLLYSLIQDLRTSLIETLDKNENEANTKEYYLKLIELLLTHIDDNIKVYSAIIKNNKNSIVMDMITDTIETDIASNITETTNTTIPSDFISKFYIGALISVGLDYLRNPKKHSKKEVLKYLEELLPNDIY